MSTSAEDQELLALRSEFPSLDKQVYLISHTLGAMPRAVRAQAQRYLDGWEIETFHTLEREWIPAMMGLSNTIGRVLGVDADTVMIVPNCSAALTAVASSFDYRGARNKVVYDNLNFTTVHYIWEVQKRNGAQICVVPSRDGISLPTDDLLAAIDEHTLIVPISHAQFRNAAAYDVERVVEKAHSVGALVFLDCYQTAGIVPVELKRWNVDMACGGSIKWACGGPGVGYLYVRPDLNERLQPTATGWLAHAEPFIFDMGPMRYAPNQWRWATGVPAVTSVYTATPGWEMLERVGIDKVRRKSLRQTALVREHAQRRGFTISTPLADAERGGTMAIDFPGAAQVCKLLQERHVAQDYRPGGGIRVSPHFYTTDDEIERFMSELDAVRATL